MQVYQLGESEAKTNQPKSKTLFGCRENNRKIQGRERERERERTCEELRTCEEPRERYEREWEQEWESPFWKIYLLNVLNSLSLKWTFIQYNVTVFQHFTTVDTKFILFYLQLIKLLIKLFSLLTPFYYGAWRKKLKPNTFFNSYNNCRNKFMNFLNFTLQLYSTVEN